MTALEGLRSPLPGLRSRRICFSQPLHLTIHIRLTAGLMALAMLMSLTGSVWLLRAFASTQGGAAGEVRLATGSPGAAAIHTGGLAQSAALARNLALLSLGGILLALPVGFALARGWARPPERRKHAADRAGQGDVDTPAPVGRHDETGAPPAAFDPLPAGLPHTPIERDIESGQAR